MCENVYKCVCVCVTTQNEKNIYQKPMEELKSERPETKIQKYSNQ